MRKNRTKKKTEEQRNERFEKIAQEADRRARPQSDKAIECPW